MLEPRVVVTLVHGTWASQAEWVKPASALSRRVASEFEGNALCEAFTWSGRNNSRARDAAAIDLSRVLRRRLDQYPKAAHFVVAHSHGGNVALAAVGKGQLFDRLNIACLSTPFFTVIPRTYLPVDLPDSAITAFTILLLMVGSLLGVTLSWWLGVAFVIATAVSIFLIARASAVAVKKIEAMTQEPPASANLLLLRMVGDEATLVIGAFQLVTWLAGMLVRLHCEMLLSMDRSGQRVSEFFLRRASLPSFLGYWAISIASVTTYGVRHHLLDWSSIAIGVVVSLVGAWFLFSVAFLTPGVAGIMMWVFLVLTLPLAVLMMAAVLLPVDGIASLASLAREVCVEPVPPGKWLLHALKPDKSSLHHSASYSSPAALDLLGTWMSEAVTRDKAA